MSAISLYCGGRFDPFNLAGQNLFLEMFVHPLALLNRYTGHTKRPLSVAEHTVRLANSKEVRKAGLTRAALLHDFNEALTNDLPHPFKAQLPEYVAMEEQVQRYIFEWYDEPWENMEALKQYDRRICQDEMSQMFVFPHDIGLKPMGVTFEGWHWELAKTMLHDACKRNGIH